MNNIQKGNKVLVTGGAGFIGSNLTDALVERGFDVHVVDNLSNGKIENVNPCAAFHKADIRNFEEITPFFEGVKYVFHTAALPRVMQSFDDPRTTHEVNVTGTLNVLLACRDANVGRVVYSASSSAYGDQEFFPLHEGIDARPMHPYGLQKYVGEQWAKLFHQLFGLSVISLRYFNVYGERAPTEGAYAQAIARFLSQRQKGEPLTIVPDGKQSRDVVHVRDVVRANILAATAGNINGYELINIGGGKDYTVLEMAEIIGGPRVFIEPRIEPRRSLADTTKAQKLLGWHPEITLEEGIAELKTAYGIS